MNDLNKILDGVDNLVKNGIPLKTDNKFSFDVGQLFILVGGFVLAGMVCGFSIAAGQKIFK